MTQGSKVQLDAKERAYLDAKLEATIKRSNGLLGYKVGTLIKNSTGETYQVQPNGSWLKLKEQADWLRKGQ